jgi:futalosine hydrolase
MRGLKGAERRVVVILEFRPPLSRKLLAQFGFDSLLVGKEMEKIDVTILGATPEEIAPLSDFFRPSSSSKIAGNQFSTYIYRDLKLLIGTTGVGKVNAAATAAAVLTSFRAGEVWNVGCAGAYGGSGLEIGDVLITENCICADEGILRKEGPMSTSSLEIPLVLKNGQPFYDCFPLDESLARRRIRAIIPAGMFSTDRSGDIRLDVLCDAHRCSFAPGSDPGKNRCFRVQYGPSLTVGMASGDIDTADARFRSLRALAENMEASAIAQTCLLFDVPFLEFRGISNMAGVRDKARWDLHAAMEHCLSVIKHLLDNR